MFYLYSAFYKVAVYLGIMLSKLNNISSDKIPFKLSQYFIMPYYL